MRKMHLQTHCKLWNWIHYSDVTMSAMVSRITGISTVCSTFCSGKHQRKHQSSVSLAFVRGIHRWSVVPLTKGQWRGKCSHLMTTSWLTLLRCSNPETLINTLDLRSSAAIVLTIYDNHVHVSIKTVFNNQRSMLRNDKNVIGFYICSIHFSATRVLNTGDILRTRACVIIFQLHAGAPFTNMD